MHSFEEIQQQGMKELSLSVSRFRLVTDFRGKDLAKTLQHVTRN